jgi:Cellulose synthase subunit D
MTVRAANNPFEGTTLDVAAKRSCAPQWRAFMEALSTTLSEVAGDELALRILGSVGAAIAKHQPVPVCSSLADLKTALNTALGVLDWGQVDIKEADKALEFVVIGYPFFESVDAQAAFAATLEAVLDGWLTMQATRPALTMRLVDRGRGAYPPLVFRYERTNSP